MLEKYPILIDKNTSLNKILNTRIFPKLLGQKNRTLKNGDRVHIELNSISINNKCVYIVIVQYLHKNITEYYSDYLEAFTSFQRIEKLLD